MPLTTVSEEFVFGVSRQRVPEKTNAVIYCSFAYSALACLRIGLTASSSFFTAVGRPAAQAPEIEDRSASHQTTAKHLCMTVRLHGSRKPFRGKPSLGLARLTRRKGRRLKSCHWAQLPKPTAAYSPRSFLRCDGCSGQELTNQAV